MLIEAGPRVLAGFPDDLSAYAQRSLEQIGVEVMLGQAVTECTADGVVYGGKRLDARTIIWAAGVRASPAAEWLNAPADRAGPAAGRARPHRARPSRYFCDRRYRDDQRPRRQSGARHRAGGQAAGTLCRRRHQGAACSGKTLAPFRYKHAGSLAQIGKRKAVIDFGRFKLRGTIAWWIWGIAHIYFLIGLRNRLSVALSWLWVHARDQRAARLITQGSQQGGAVNSLARSSRGEASQLAAGLPHFTSEHPPSAIGRNA